MNEVENAVIAPEMWHCQLNETASQVGGEDIVAQSLSRVHKKKVEVVNAP